MKRQFLICIACIIPFLSRTQTAGYEFIRTCSSPFASFSLLPKTNGGYLEFGFDASCGYQGSSVRSFDPQGNLMDSYDIRQDNLGSTFDFSNSLWAPDGDFVIALSNKYGFNFVKSDTNGGVDFIHYIYYPNANNLYCKKLSLHNNAYYINGGYITQDSAFQYLIKLDLMGNIAWSRTFGMSNNDWSSMAAYDVDFLNNGFILTGSLGGDFNTCLLKLDASGNLLQAKAIYSPIHLQGGRELVPRMGKYRVFSATVDHTFVIDIDTSLSTIIQKKSIRNITPHKIIAGPDQDYMIAGEYFNITNAWIRIDSNGALAFSQVDTIGGPYAGLRDGFRRGCQYLFMGTASNFMLTDEAAGICTSLDSSMYITTPSYTLQTLNIAQSNSMQPTASPQPSQIIQTNLTFVTDCWNTIELFGNCNASLDAPEWEKADISVYPNPASSVVFIEGIQKGSSVTLTDIQGKIIFQNVNSSGLMSIDVSGLKKALYFVLVNDGGIMTSSKILVQ